MLRASSIHAFASEVPEWIDPEKGIVSVLSIVTASSLRPELLRRVEARVPCAIDLILCLGLPRTMMIGSQQFQSSAEQVASQSASSNSQQPGGTSTVTAAAIPQDPPTPGHRHIYLVSQCYQPGRSHWSLWIPSLQNPLIGRVIHVRGSVIRGFAVEFKDNHKFDDSESYQFTHLGQVPATSLVDPPDDRDGIRVEGDVRDDYDIAAYALELPGPARDSPEPEPLDDPIWNRPHPRFERCQEWTRRLIADLVADGKLPRSAIQAMDTATSYTDERGTHFAYNRFAPPYGI